MKTVDIIQRSRQDEVISTLENLRKVYKKSRGASWRKKQRLKTQYGLCHALDKEFWEDEDVYDAAIEALKEMAPMFRGDTHNKFWWPEGKIKWRYRCVCFTLYKLRQTRWEERNDNT